MNKRLVIALGGNALMRKGEEGNFDQQLFHARQTGKHIAHLLSEGYEVAITHGNGPQVGSILLKNELSKDQLPPMPLDACGAESQGLIGYMIQKELYQTLKGSVPVITIVTQVLVDKADEAFSHPTKPIGIFYTEEEAKNLEQFKHWKMVYQEGKGFRRVVPSPKPIDIIEKDIIQLLVDKKVLIICCGGGGIPVVKTDLGHLDGVEAVIDKDLTGALFAHTIKADTFLILTDVEKVAVNFGKPNQKNLDNLTLTDAKNFLKDGEFAAGSMGPKVSAAVSFLEHGGKRAIITSLEKALHALKGESGTHFIK